MVFVAKDAAWQGLRNPIWISLKRETLLVPLSSHKNGVTSTDFSIEEPRGKVPSTLAYILLFQGMMRFEHSDKLR